MHLPLSSEVALDSVGREVPGRTAVLPPHGKSALPGAKDVLPIMLTTTFCTIHAVITDMRTDWADDYHMF